MRAMNMNSRAGFNTAPAPAPAAHAAPAALCTTDGLLQTTHSGFQGGGYGQQGSGNADCLLLSTLADGSLALGTDAAAGLIYMIEEEKMARDLYDAFAEQTGSVVFDRISDSEQKHLDSLLLVAQKAGIDLTAVSTTAGVFTNTAIQSLYDTLLAQGSVSLDAAYGVGVLVEQTDIADLQEYSADASIGIVGTIYGHLETGSEHHLAAFTQYAALV
jgi:hypothetical protein